MRWLCVSVIALVPNTGCGRSSPEPLDGSEGGSCYGNGTCDAGLVCLQNRICVSREAFACAGVTCSGHGRCTLAMGYPTCSCDAGFESLGLACAPGCYGESCCPLDMALVEISSVRICVDKYEATVFADPTCVGTRFGEGNIQDYPAGFPYYVESAGCTGTCLGQAVEPATTQIFACSVPGVRPSANLSWFQAKRTCENAGKRLCEELEWRVACGGPQEQPYPYGEAPDESVCNFQLSGPGHSVATGSMPTCEGGFQGLFDMNGNLVEWTAQCRTTDNVCYSRGGNFEETATSVLDGCNRYIYWGLGPGYARPQLGFRCCRSL